MYGPAYAANVVGMVCMRPWEGWPARAFTSHKLIARGFPPDSNWMRRSTASTAEAGCPSWATTWVTMPRHRAVPAPPPNSPPPAPEKSFVSPDPRPTNSFALLMSMVAMDLGAPATILPNVESRPGSFDSRELRGP
jgi:hypothetical protein